MSSSFKEFFDDAKESGFLEHISEIGTEEDFLHSYFVAAIWQADTPEDREALKRAKDIALPRHAAEDAKRRANDPRRRQKLDAPDPTA